MSSQIARPADDEKYEIGLHSGKDSGSLENSSGLVIGAWRDSKDREKMFLQVLKDTKGTSWPNPIVCEYKGEMSLIRMPQAPARFDDIPMKPTSNDP